MSANDARSPHADRRCQQRAIAPAAIEATLDWGDMYRQERGRRAYFLGKRAVERAAKEGERIASFGGTAVIVAKDGALVTAIRCSDPKRLRRHAR